MGLSDAVETVGFKSLGVKLSLETLEEAPLPCILHWNKNHFVVLYKIKKDTYYISDPATWSNYPNEGRVFKTLDR